jgi:hypothetical protein
VVFDHSAKEAPPGVIAIMWIGCGRPCIAFAMSGTHRWLAFWLLTAIFRYVARGLDPATPLPVYPQPGVRVAFDEAGLADHSSPLIRTPTGAFRDTWHNGPEAS